MVKSEKSAPYLRRRLLSGDLLKTNDVGRKIIQDRPENGHPTYEFHFVRSRPIKIFEINVGNAYTERSPTLPGIRKCAAARLPVPLRRLGTYVHPAVIGEALQKLAEQLDRASPSTGV